MAIDRRAVAAAFRALHAPGRLLVLPNAWDAGSARFIEASGAAAIATTSSGLAWAHGYPDGNALPPQVVAAATAEIVRAVRVPVSVDVEAGYSEDPDAVAEVVATVADAGAVGVNLEDGAGPPELLCAKIEPAKRGALRAGVDVFVNARIDVYLRRTAPAETRVAATLDRAARYRAAGCDGVFVPGASVPEEIGALVRGVDPLPLNVMAVPHLPGADALRALGVRRLSAGGALAAAALGLVQRLASAFLAHGLSDPLFPGAVEYLPTNQLFRRA